jgi:site-specific DNA-methyltransferase (adenine-specific)
MIEDGRYKLYQGDCLEVMDGLISLGVKFDAIITDIPYGTTACKWDSVIPLDEMWERLNKLIKLNRAIVLFGSEPFTSKLRISNIKNYKHEWYWNKNNSGNILCAKYMPLKVIENICIFSNGKCTYNPQMIKRTEKEEKEFISKRGKNHTTKKSDMFSGIKSGAFIHTSNTKYKYPINLLNFNARSNECNNRIRVHPTQKPVALLEYLIKTYTNEGDLVLDFTMGSGSTGVACMNTNRRFVGIELDENYFNIAKNRIENIS